MISNCITSRQIRGFVDVDYSGKFYFRIITDSGAVFPGSGFLTLDKLDASAFEMFMKHVYDIADDVI
jgi:hypothetical protein